MIDGPRLLLFPGLGTDVRLFGTLMGLPAQTKVAQWIAPESSQESLAHYAERMAHAVALEPGMHVGGISLGAMVALEAAPWLGARSVFLIAGCRSHRQISPLFRALLATVAVMPEEWIRPSLLLGPPALKLFEHLTPSQIHLMMTMLRENSPRQTRWSCRALLRWDCCRLPSDMPIHAIHGELDEVIPARPARPGSVVVAGAHHLVSLSHPDIVTKFILDRLSP